MNWNDADANILSIYDLNWYIDSSSFTSYSRQMHWSSHTLNKYNGLFNWSQLIHIYIFITSSQIIKYCKQLLLYLVQMNTSKRCPLQGITIPLVDPTQMNVDKLQGPMCILLWLAWSIVNWKQIGHYKVVFTRSVQIAMYQWQPLCKGIICSQHSLPVVSQSHHHLVYPVAVSRSFPLHCVS
jgi:hypothetical protein